MGIAIAAGYHPRRDRNYKKKEKPKDSKSQSDPDSIKLELESFPVSSEIDSLQNSKTNNIKELNKQGHHSVLAQVKNGLHCAHLFLMPLWLGTWLLGWAYNKTIQAFGLDSPSPQIHSISKELKDDLYRNTTQLISLPKEQLWEQSAHFRKNLSLRSPELAQWFENKYSRNKIKFVSDSDQSFGALEGRYTDYRKYEDVLTIYPSFWGTTDAEKVNTLAHEYSHARENWGEYLSNSLLPQVVVGSIIRAEASCLVDLTFPTSSTYLAKIHELADSLSNEDSWPAQWSYYGNASERKAVAEEHRMSNGMMDDADINAGVQDKKKSKIYQEIPGQEFGGLALSVIYGRHLALLFKRKMAKKKKENSDKLLHKPKDKDYLGRIDTKSAKLSSV